MDFQNLEEYYNYLENDTNFQYLDLNMNKYITALKNLTEDKKTKKLCSYELFFADFSIEKGILIPKFQNGSKSYPTLELFEDNFDYLKIRANNVKNPKYKSKYNHLLWLCPKKQFDFAKQAIDSYFMLLQNSSFSVNDNLQCRSFSYYFKNLFVLCETVNYKKVEVINYLVSLLASDKLNGFTKCSLMEFIVLNGKKIDSTIIHIFYDYSNKKITNLETRVLESYLKLLVILCQKLKISPSIFHEKLGDYHISRLKNVENLCFVLHYANALKEYEKANNKEKIEQTAVLFEQAKKNITFKKVSYEMENEINKNLFSQRWALTNEKVTLLIENGNYNDIYEYLIFEKIFPKATILNEENKSVTPEIFSILSFDINKNINKNKSKIINLYSEWVYEFSIHHIWLVVSKGIISGKISYESLIAYLKGNSWYGQDFTYVDKNNEIQGVNWIELLAPSLQSFFIQTEIDIKTNNHNPQGYILGIDSLVLKFEGLLREFSRMIGAQTIEIVSSGTEERIKFDNLLDNEKLKALVTEDDIAYFKFFFARQGINLRNNIAHCFFRTKNYSSAIMLLLIVALLRLGNYKLETKQTISENIKV